MTTAITHDIIVSGASSGGLEALQTVVGGLPPDLRAAVFVVWHMAPNSEGVLPRVLQRVTSLPTAHAKSGELIVPGRIYVAPPDHHLLLEGGRVNLTRGPKENRFRPAVDPLFRSAANAYGARVIGVILTGALDDGTGGLWTIKSRGGLAVVQDPTDAEVASMPEAAIRAVEVDHVVPVDQIATLLACLSRGPQHGREASAPEDADMTEIDLHLAAAREGPTMGSLAFGDQSPFACPECHGALSVFEAADMMRFRCRTGHVFSADDLLAAITHDVEKSLYRALRAIDERVGLLNHLGDHLAEKNQAALAAHYFLEAQEAEAGARLVRRAFTQPERPLHERPSAPPVEPESEAR